jgi:ABC-type nitrate/sulfonate/bicarbonate transport system permease component
VIGYTLAALIGVSLGISMGSNKYVRGYFHPIISTLMPVPGITWAPILVLVLGFGDPTLIAVTFIASIFPIVYNTSAGVSSAPMDLLWAARIMGANRPNIFFRVLLPSSAPFILTGLKLGLARAWRTLIAVEMIAATLWGLGFFIFDAKEYLRTSDIYAGIVVLAIVFILIERSSFGTIEKRTIERWGMVRDIG